MARRPPAALRRHAIAPKARNRNINDLVSKNELSYFCDAAGPSHHKRSPMLCFPSPSPGDDFRCQSCPLGQAEPPRAVWGRRRTGRRPCSLRWSLLDQRVKGRKTVTEEKSATRRAEVISLAPFHRARSTTMAITTGTPPSRRGQRGGRVTSLEKAREHPDKIFPKLVRLTGREVVAGYRLAEEAGVSFAAYVAQLIRAEQLRQQRSPLATPRGADDTSSSAEPLPGMEPPAPKDAAA